MCLKSDYNANQISGLESMKEKGIADCPYGASIPLGQPLKPYFLGKSCVCEGKVAILR